MTRVGPGQELDGSIVTAIAVLRDWKLETGQTVEPSDWAGQTGQSGWPVVAAPVTGSALQLAAAIEKLIVTIIVTSSTRSKVHIPHCGLLAMHSAGASPGPGPSCYHDRAT